MTDPVDEHVQPYPRDLRRFLARYAPDGVVEDAHGAVWREVTRITWRVGGDRHGVVASHVADGPIDHGAGSAERH